MTLTSRPILIELRTATYDDQMPEEQSDKRLSFDYLSLLKKIGIGIVIVSIFSWLFLSPPYNATYLLKRVLYTPTAICEDGIYSFSASRSGTCSNHGGVKNWIK